MSVWIVLFIRRGANNILLFLGAGGVAKMLTSRPGEGAFHKLDAASTQMVLYIFQNLTKY